MIYKRNQVVYKIGQDGNTIARGLICNPRYVEYANEYIQVKWNDSRLSYYNLNGGTIWESLVIICDMNIGAQL
jgi:hypothetical protein